MKNKDQQAQQYAEKKLRTTYSNMTLSRIDKAVDLFDTYDIQQAYFDGYTAAEQSMTDSEATVIQGWVARDKSGDLYMYRSKPLRNMAADRWRGEMSEIDLYNNLLFPDLTWDDEPLEVELTYSHG